MRWAESKAHEDAGLVLRYIADEDPVLLFRGFAKHQQLRYERETPSEYDPPPGYIRTDAGLVPDEVRTTATPVPDELRSTAGALPDTLRSTAGAGPAQVQVEVQDQVYNDDLAAASTSPTEPASPASKRPAAASSLEPQPEQTTERPSAASSLKSQVKERLKKEWDMLTPGQVTKHTALAERYGFDAWQAGFNRTKPGARSNHAYAEKCIISEIESPTQNGRDTVGDIRPSRTGYYEFPSMSAYIEWAKKHDAGEEQRKERLILVKGTLRCAWYRLGRTQFTI